MYVNQGKTIFFYLSSIDRLINTFTCHSQVGWQSLIDTLTPSSLLRLALFTGFLLSLLSSVPHLFPVNVCVHLFENTRARSFKKTTLNGLTLQVTVPLFNPSLCFQHTKLKLNYRLRIIKCQHRLCFCTVVVTNVGFYPKPTITGQQRRSLFQLCQWWMNLWLKNTH